MSRLPAGRCANPLCACETPEFTCSLWCGPLDVRQNSRCLCRHERCAPLASRLQIPALADPDLYPAILDRFRLDRRVTSGGGR